MKRILYIVGISCLIVLLFFLCFYYKKNNIGNNIDRKDENKVINHILGDFRTYEAEVEVRVYSNKTENEYKIKQVCNTEKSYQEINEPEELKGIYIELEHEKLTVGNSKQNIKKIYEKYKNILNNSLFLNVFIQEYKSNDTKEKSRYYEENDNYIMEVNLDENFNTYAKTKKLYINKKSKKPEKLEIYDNAKNIKVCIIYNYIEIK